MFKVGRIGGIDKSSISKEVYERAKKASRLIYEQVAEGSEPFTPYLSGNLDRSLRPVEEDGFVVGWEYTEPYAKYLYNGGEDYDWTRDTHKNAGPRWLHRGWEVKKKQIIALANKELSDG